LNVDHNQLNVSIRIITTALNLDTVGQKSFKFDWLRVTKVIMADVIQDNILGES